MSSDVMACGCYWTRETSGPVLGDVLHQCDRHRAGARYEGSEPSGETAATIAGLAANRLGLRARVLHRGKS